MLQKFFLQKDENFSPFSLRNLLPILVHDYALLLRRPLFQLETLCYHSEPGSFYLLSRLWILRVQQEHLLLYEGTPLVMTREIFPVHSLLHSDLSKMSEMTDRVLRSQSLDGCVNIDRCQDDTCHLLDDLISGKSVQKLVADEWSTKKKLAISHCVVHAPPVQIIVHLSRVTLTLANFDV